MIRKFIFDKEYWILRHASFWFVMYLGEFLSVFGLTDFLDSVPQFFLSFSLDVILVYFNIYYLLPKLLLKNRLFEYAMYTNLTILLVVTYSYLEDRYIFGEFDTEVFYFYTTTYLFTMSVLATAVAIKAAKIIHAKSKKEIELIELKRKAEVNALKEQINPHFLFNSLNNLYILAKTKDDSLPEQMLKLSDLMRYQTYEATKDSIRLSKEIEFLRNYLALEQMRRSNLDISISASTDAKNMTVEPLLFLPFVENATKHSFRSDNQIAKIKLDWSVTNGTLLFTCRNTQGNSNHMIKDDDAHGFGLKNITSRLALLYPDRHQLNIDDGDELFTVNLSIDV